MRTLLLLLLAPALLMPPGVCLCQFVPCGESAGVPRSGLPASTRPSCGGQFEETCACAKRRLAADGRKPTAAAEGRAAVFGDEKPAQLPGKHSQGCPAVTGEDQAKLAQTPSPVLPSADLTCHVFQLVDTPARPAAREERAPVRPVSSPLFIAHCALLI